MSKIKQPSEYWYTDIAGYYYVSDKIIMKDGVVFSIDKLRHLPRAIEYANHEDVDYRKNLVTQEENAGKKQGVHFTTTEDYGKFNVNGKIYTADEYAKYKEEEKMKKTSVKRTKYQLDDTEATEIPMMTGEDFDNLSEAFKRMSAAFAKGFSETSEELAKMEKKKADSQKTVRKRKPTPLQTRLRKLGR